MRHACEVTVNKFICVLLGLKEFKFSCEGNLLDLEEFLFPVSRILCCRCGNSYFPVFQSL